jgi:processive 1,2-diacylglycerol beta-glucosyltransferase
LRDRHSIDPVFEKPVDKYEARKKLGLSAEGRVLLVSAGGYSVGPVEQLVKDLLATERPWQIVTVAGKSGRLQKRRNELANSAGKLPDGNARLVVVGFTSEMDPYMATADALIGKAGGVTTSQALPRFADDSD